MKTAARAVLMGLTCLAAATAACMPEERALSKPDSKCAKTDPVESAICADSALQKLEGEIAVALTKARGLYPNDPAAAEALSDARANAIRLRQSAGRDGAITLADALQGELNFLRSLMAPRQGFEGRWLSPQGDILITKEPDGFGIHAVAAEQSRGAWICEVQTPASLIKDSLFATDGSRGLGDPPLDGWIIEGMRQGATLFVKEVAPRADMGMTAAIRPYCGMSGGLDGPYFPANAR